MTRRWPDVVEFDRNGLEILDRQTCLRLLGSVPVGRVGLCMNALPVVLPVNFVLRTPPWGEGPAVIVRSGDGTKFAAALRGHVIAFEIDGYDAMAHAGWSVVVQGTTRVLAEPPEVEWASQLPLQPWASDRADVYIELGTDLVSGRRFGSG